MKVRRPSLDFEQTPARWAVRMYRSYMAALEAELA